MTTILLLVLAGIAIIVIARFAVLRKNKSKPQPIVHEVDDRNWEEDIENFMDTALKSSTLVTHLHAQWEFAHRRMIAGGVSKKFDLKLGEKPEWMTWPDMLVVQEGDRFDVNAYFKRARIGDELIVVNRRVRIFALRRRKQYGFRDDEITVRRPYAGDFPYLLGPYKAKD